MSFIFFTLENDFFNIKIELGWFSNIKKHFLVLENKFLI